MALISQDFVNREDATAIFGERHIHTHSNLTPKFHSGKCMAKLIIMLLSPIVNILLVIGQQNKAP